MLQARINTNKMYNLVSWDAQSFNANLTLLLQSMDLEGVARDFSEITKLEIFQNQVLQATYSCFDSYENIAYIGKQYVQSEDIFADTLSVHLTKTNIIEQVQRLDEQINPVIDLESLTMEELRRYKLKKVSEDCEQDIFNGETITMPNGDREKFTFKTEDQINLKSLYDIIIANPTVESLPYHPVGGTCRIYDRQSIITVYTTLLLRLTQLTTYANQLNMYIRAINDRDELMEVEYGMTLPEVYMNNIAEIMGITIAEMEKIIHVSEEEN